MTKGPEGYPSFEVARPGSKLHMEAARNPDKFRIVGNDEEVDIPSVGDDPRRHILLGTPRRKADPKACLADDVLDPRNEVTLGTNDIKGYRHERELLRGAKRLLFDDAAATLLAELSIFAPKDACRMIDAAEPPADVTWIEWRVLPFRDFQNRYLNPDYDNTKYIESRKSIREDCKMGLLIQRDGRQIHIQRFEHKLGAPMYSMSVIAFRIDLDGTAFSDLKVGDALRSDKYIAGVTKKGRMPPLEQAALIWGYEPDTPGDAADYKPLVGRALASTHWTVIERLSAEQHRKEMQVQAGILRTALAALSLINSVASIENDYRPSGHRIIGGSSRPYVTRANLTITVPRRIRNVAAYVRKEIGAAAARKRLHEVRAHYRHLRSPPNQPGWKEVEIDGTTYWRKQIAAHLRGDPDLGVVEHVATDIKGPRE